MKRGFRGKKGRSQNEYVRATALFPVDDEYLPRGAKYALRGRASGEFAENVAEVIEKAIKRGLDISFSVTKWKGDDNPVLSVGAVEPKERGGKRRRDRDEEDDEPRGKRRDRGRDRDEEDSDDDEKDEKDEKDDDEPDNDDDVPF